MLIDVADRTEVGESEGKSAMSIKSVRPPFTRAQKRALKRIPRNF